MLLRARKSEEGFGLIELLMSMTMLNVGILALIAAFQSGAFALQRASKLSTAAAIADIQLERYRVDVYIAADSVTAARPLKRVTVVIRDGNTPTKVYARVASTFDEATGS